MTVPGALDVLKHLSQSFSDEVLLGAGTVLDSQTARAAILAGANFIIAPTLDIETIRLCKRYSKIVIPGTLTPTEVLQAWELGADFISQRTPLSFV